MSRKSARSSLRQQQKCVLSNFELLQEIKTDIEHPNRTRYRSCMFQERRYTLGDTIFVENSAGSGVKNIAFISEIAEKNGNPLITGCWLFSAAHTYKYIPQFTSYKDKFDMSEVLFSFI